MNSAAFSAASGKMAPERADGRIVGDDAHGAAVDPTKRRDDLLARTPFSSNTDSASAIRSSRSRTS